jgi:PAS domain S-box-containing protein
MNPDGRAPAPPEDPGRLRSLSVLYVDDEPVLLDICRLYLLKHDITVTPASSVREALILMESNHFDLILSDYEMPGIDGAGFLNILREKHITLPVVIFSGKAPDKMPGGVFSSESVYYVRKGGEPRKMFEELAGMIREVSPTDQEKALPRKIALQYRTLFEQSGAAVVTLDDSLLITTANAGFEKLTGYGKDEIEGILRWGDVVHDRDAGQMMEYICHLRQGTTPSGKELSFCLRTKNNQIRPVLATISPVPDTPWSVASLIEIWQSPLYRDRQSTKT